MDDEGHVEGMPRCGNGEQRPAAGHVPVGWAAALDMV